MAIINRAGYVLFSTNKRTGSYSNETKAKLRNWSIVKARAKCDTGVIRINQIYLPPEYLGKRVRVKVELVD